VGFNDASSAMTPRQNNALKVVMRGAENEDKVAA
jgi:hypothetical protein